MTDTKKDVTLPPDQSLRISTLGDRFVLLGVSDTALYVGDGNQYKDFTSYTRGAYIFTENIAIASSIHSPYGLTVASNTIVTTAIDVSAAGLAGDDQTTTTAAQRGKHGGHLNFYVQRGTDENAKRISWVATGGKGGDATVADSQAGDGGDGGEVVRIFVSWYAKLFAAFAAFIARAGTVSRESTVTVSADDAIYLAAVDLSKLPVSDMPSSITTPMQTFKDTVTKIVSGKSITLYTLVIDARRVRNALVTGVDSQKSTSFSSNVNVAGGVPGSGKHVVARTGAYGKGGADTPLLLPQHDTSYKPLDDRVSLRQSTFAFAHPEQCAMLLTRANLYYYMGSPSLRQQAVQLYTRIIDRLAFLPLSPDDPLYKAYSSSTVMPIHSVETLKTISDEASQQLTHIAHGVDFNGFKATDVPRASYTFYQGVIDTALNDLVAFEDAYVKYHATLHNEDELKDAINSALNKNDAMVKSLNADIDDLLEGLQQAGNAIDLLAQPVKDAQAALDAQFHKVESQIKNSFGLSVPQLVNALNACAFAPNKFMIGLQAVNLVWTGMTEVPDIGGNAVNKNVLIGKLTKAEATVKGIKDTLSQSKLDGSFQLDDPFGTHLMVIENDMMAFLSDYATSSFKDVIAEMQQKFDDYVSAVVARNKQVMIYNTVLKLLVQKRDLKKRFEAKYNELNGKVIAKTDPDLPAITAYMNDIYQSARARVMKLLNLLIRSLNFRMLKDYDIFTLAFSGHNSNTVPLTMTANVLRSAKSSVEKEFSQQVRIWGKEPSKFPGDWSKLRGKRIRLGDGPCGDLKGDKHKTDVVIPPVFKETTPKNDFSGCCNVRVYMVRLVFDGLKVKGHAKSGRLTATMTHSGTEIVVDKDNLEHKYTHDSIKVDYSFNLNADGTMDPLSDGNIAMADVNNQVTAYAAPGPFTSWHIDLTASETTHLDFSDVKAIYLDFCGTNYAL